MQSGLQPLFGPDGQGILLHPRDPAHTHTHTHTHTPAQTLTTVCAHTTNLDEVLVDPLGEGFLLHTVPFIWERQGQVTWAWKKPRKPPGGDHHSDTVAGATQNHTAPHPTRPQVVLDRSRGPGPRCPLLGLPRWEGLELAAAPGGTAHKSWPAPPPHRLPPGA